MGKIRFGSENAAEFGALMTGLFPIKDGESGFFRLLSSAEAKQEIKSLLAKGEYDTAGKIGERLSKQISIVLEERTKSFRVSFSEYLSLVSEALNDGIALSDAIKKHVMSCLQKVVKAYSARDNVNRENLSLFERAISSWSEVHPEKRKSYTKRKRSEVESSARKGDYERGSSGESHEDYYRPYYLVYGNPPVEALRGLLVDSEVKEHSDILLPEVLQALFGAAKTELERAGVDHVFDIGEMFPLVICRASDKDLKIEFGYIDSLMTEESWDRLGKRFPNFDDETMEKIRGLSEFADDEPFYHSCRKVVVASIEVKTDREEVFVAGFPVTEDGHVLKEALLKKLTSPPDEDHLKAQASEALDKNDLAKFTELNEKLKKKRRSRELMDFALETILPVLKRSQSVSFRAPDLLVRAWEAYGNIGLESSTEGEEVEG